MRQNLTWLHSLHLIHAAYTSFPVNFFSQTPIPYTVHPVSNFLSFLLFMLTPLNKWRMVQDQWCRLDWYLLQPSSHKNMFIYSICVHGHYVTPLPCDYLYCHFSYKVQPTSPWTVQFGVYLSTHVAKWPLMLVNRGDNELNHPNVKNW